MMLSKRVAEHALHTDHRHAARHEALAVPGSAVLPKRMKWIEY
jgi:hypothetical protein